MAVFPERILVAAGLEESEAVERATAAAPGAPVEVFDDGLSLTLSRLERLGAEEAKKTLVIARRRGGFVKPFPSGRGMRSSPWHYFIPAIGCPADCRYCFLQVYHPANSPVVFADQAAMLAEIERKSDEVGGGYFYGGELCDNLMLERFLGITGPLIDLFRRLPDATLELRTKSADVGALLEAGTAPNVVVSWTFSPETLARDFEPGAASAADRIEAARRVQRVGFRVGVRFDPIVLFEGWREEYEALVSILSAALDASLVESAHLGCIRFTPALKQVVQERFGRTSPFDGEFAASSDGKLRYPRPLRSAAYAEIARMIARWDNGIAVRLCMETPQVEADFTSFAAGR
ncbi:MAG: hypothetical protein J7M19_03805 [Planctomycetes bacterium]|nr:hypothetical protein [Planctomycetota bacterium]